MSDSLVMDKSPIVVPCPPRICLQRDPRDEHHSVALVDARPPARVGTQLQNDRSRRDGSLGRAGTRHPRAAAAVDRFRRSRRPKDVSAAERPYADQPDVQP